MSSLQKRVLVSKLPPRPPLCPTPKTRARNQRDYTPIHFSNYFTACKTVTIDKGELGQNHFCVYEIGSGEGPAIFMLHGGGFSALTWALTSQVLNSLISCRIYAMDIRGHGTTTTIDDSDLSATTLASDIIDVIEKVVGELGDPAPEVVIVGHSMGGALAVHAALAEAPIPNLVGICVIDVVEGTAMDALSSMQGFLRSRPCKFKSLEQAIEWCVRSGQVRNAESARLSMPGQLINATTGCCAVTDVHPERHSVDETADHPLSGGLPMAVDVIAEDEEEEKDETKSADKPAAVNLDDDSKPTDRKLFKIPSQESPPDEPSPLYIWRIDLTKTEQFWAGWFKGLSSKFLSVPASKLLLLAGVDRLDRDLTVGQMQGKFQMQILPQAGHAVHEDVPDRVAEVLASFLVRNKFATPLATFMPAMPGC